MWVLVSILIGLGSVGFIVLIFGLMKAGRRADEGEEKILELMNPPCSQSKKAEEDKANSMTSSHNLTKIKLI